MSLASLPSWITQSGYTFTISPDTATLTAGNDYTLSVTWTPSSTGTNAGAVTYDAATITVTCDVTSLTAPSIPSQMFNLGISGTYPLSAYSFE